MYVEFCLLLFDLRSLPQPLVTLSVISFESVFGVTNLSFSSVRNEEANQRISHKAFVACLVLKRVRGQRDLAAL